mgnify:CR=1 FL=1|jgi:hypothetical protein
MQVIYNIALIYGLTFLIGFFVSGIIWVLFNSMTAKDSNRLTTLRESYSEMKRLKLKNAKSVK